MSLRQSKGRDLIGHANSKAVSPNGYVVFVSRRQQLSLRSKVVAVIAVGNGQRSCSIVTDPSHHDLHKILRHTTDRHAGQGNQFTYRWLSEIAKLLRPLQTRIEQLHITDAATLAHTTFTNSSDHSNPLTYGANLTASQFAEKPGSHL